MSKRFSLINLSIAIIFLLSTVFPPGAFSYQSAKDAQERDLVDESKGMNIASFKKVRCPNCGMEFFYCPGKETPHSHWVQYEVKDDKEESEPLSDLEKEIGDQVSKVSELKKQTGLWYLLDRRRWKSLLH